MITIYTTTSLMEQVSEIIATQERMWELVNVEDMLKSKPEPSGNTMIVSNEGIRFPIDWFNTAPPYILPEFILFTEEILLGLIYFKLGNIEAAFSLLKNEGPLLSEFAVIEKLKNQIFTNPEELAVETYKDFDDYRLMHNHGIVRYYNGQDHADRIHYYFNTAMDDAPSDEYLAFTAKHYMNFLLDIQSYELAEKIGNNVLSKDISNHALLELKQLVTQVLLNKLRVPYDADVMDRLKENIWFLVEGYGKEGRKVELALALEDATHIANISKSFAESLGYITKAIKIYQEEELVDFQYNAILKRGQLLYSWAQSGQVQFYKPAIDSFQEAIKFFNKTDYPTVFAEIQTNLGVIYSEIPDEIKKKSLWAAISHSAFMEALSVFTKEDYPYEYAYVCNSLGNALTKYPAAIHSDNFEKALYYYNEALDVRNAYDFPVERSMTLLNYIEAAWNADNSGNENNSERYRDMWDKCEEIIRLKQGHEFTSAAEDHKTRLVKLEELLNN